MIYEYITIEEVKDTGKTKVWLVDNKKHGDPLGTIRWYGPWRQYVFAVDLNCLFSAGCLDDIRSFIANEMAKRKQAPPTLRLPDGVGVD